LLAVQFRWVFNGTVHRYRDESCRCLCAFSCAASTGVQLTPRAEPRCLQRQRTHSKHRCINADATGHHARSTIGVDAAPCVTGRLVAISVVEQTGRQVSDTLAHCSCRTSQEAASRCRELGWMIAHVRPNVSVSRSPCHYSSVLAHTGHTSATHF
jgi:hypothetical protein